MIGNVSVSAPTRRTSSMADVENVLGPPIIHWIPCQMNLAVFTNVALENGIETSSSYL